MKKLLAIVIATALAICGVALATRTTPDTTQNLAVTGAGLLKVIIDVDHPPASVNVLSGGTITLTKQGRATGQVQVTTFGTDGRGEIFIKLPGGPIGTVATLRTIRSGNGMIQIRQPPSPGGRGFATINVFVH
ncbi:MAG: hypothetical protein SGJ27_12285 [Candidatus Melainabacteria bacterium]|nr:hypothetical protein [Candidatus Melainabacteria bacterium]